MPNPYRVLVTGSRDWQDRLTVRRALAAASSYGTRDLIVVHGACPTGADQHAAEWAEEYGELLGVTAEPHPADWKRYGRLAGPRRNAEMVNLGADICLAFIRNGSRGASHTADLAEQAGIPTRRFTA